MGYSIKRLIDRLFGTREERLTEKQRAIIDEIASLEAEIERMRKFGLCYQPEQLARMQFNLDTRLHEVTKELKELKK